MTAPLLVLTALLVAPREDVLIILPSQAPDAAFEATKLRSALNLYFKETDYQVLTMAVSDETSAVTAARGSGARFVAWFRWTRLDPRWRLEGFLTDLEGNIGKPIRRALVYATPTPELYRAAALRIASAFRAARLRRLAGDFDQDPETELEPEPIELVESVPAPIAPQEPMSFMLGASASAGLLSGELGPFIGAHATMRRAGPWAQGLSIEFGFPSAAAPAEAGRLRVSFTVARELGTSGPFRFFGFGNLGAITVYDSSTQGARKITEWQFLPSGVFGFSAAYPFANGWSAIATGAADVSLGWEKASQPGARTYTSHPVLPRLGLGLERRL